MPSLTLYLQNVPYFDVPDKSQRTLLFSLSFMRILFEQCSFGIWRWTIMNWTDTHPKYTSKLRKKRTRDSSLEYIFMGKVWKLPDHTSHTGSDNATVSNINLLIVFKHLLFTLSQLGSSNMLFIISSNGFQNLLFQWSLQYVRGKRINKTS